ncbi:hypothetical protein JRO89_XS07G0070300 [Xanthoceras sorbifolium]|uniref:Thioredoxin domain-containing protein n=1 Tax=Xanthoceras sorbifolium TaxID=99658 RepID=A0ABQ8HSX5_9ROSI|nr:hypothetical protein JRO89_XS07G0070300 [Xanthoceras sorbifolium]
MSFSHSKLLFSSSYRNAVTARGHSCGGLLYVVMQKQNILYRKDSFKFGIYRDGKFDSRIPCVAPIYVPEKTHAKSFCMRAKIPSISRCTECVREFKTDEEFFKILERAKEMDSLVVVDFYRTSCGSCKYIEQGFAKLCKGSGDEDAPVIFLKHNVIDEYDEQSEVAERLRIKTVPLFHFYKNGLLLESFATRDKERIDAAILKYTSSDD